MEPLKNINSRKKEKLFTTVDSNKTTMLSSYFNDDLIHVGTKIKVNK